MRLAYLAAERRDVPPLAQHSVRKKFEALESFTVSTQAAPPTIPPLSPYLTIPYPPFTTRRSLAAPVRQHDPLHPHRDVGRLRSVQGTRQEAAEAR